MTLVRRQFIRTIALCLVFILSAGFLHAQSVAALSQGFLTNSTNLATGALMSLETQSSNTVKLANSNNVDSLVGVIGENELVELGSSDSEVQVVMSGVAVALVSDINGDVVVGDRITASPIDGMGMKAAGSTQVVGTAQADLASVETTERTITQTNGLPQVIKAGLVPVQINVTFYAGTDNSVTYLPAFMQNFANSIVGKQVSPIRVLLAALVLFLAFVSMAILLYSSVKSSIISIGRNPLSESAVRKSLIQVGLTIVGILLLALIAIYLILVT